MGISKLTSNYGLCHVFCAPKINRLNIFKQFFKRLKPFPFILGPALHENETVGALIPTADQTKLRIITEVRSHKVYDRQRYLRREIQSFMGLFIGSP